MEPTAQDMNGCSVALQIEVYTKLENAGQERGLILL